MNIKKDLSLAVSNYLKENHNVEASQFEFQQTRKEFKGDITLVVFPLLKQIKTNPKQLAENIGDYLKKHIADIEDFNVVKGFLNISFTNNYFIKQLQYISKTKNYGFKEVNENSPRVMVEYSSPNTNKPLHLGHIRNNLLGYSVAEILKANGNKVYKTQIINDRGIHICKSMLAWQKFGNGETPESSGIKGDHLVGKYYVLFDKAYKKEIEELETKGYSIEEAKKTAPILIEAQELLKKWENHDIETVNLWKKMNSWVYEGFEETYKSLGVDFDKNYYESETYILGKDEILKGVKDGIFYKKEDNSVWIDLTDEGLDEKLVLRSDGTSVYMTQDIGTAIKRVKEFNISSLIYTVGNEQDYHFKVLFLILKKLGYKWAESLYHLSYGMVELPDGKMKSREGTVVDADTLIEEMIISAKNISDVLGKIDDLKKDEKQELYNNIGKGALKYFILKVDPRKNIMFNPKESIDFHGNTGPFIQYTYARIQSLKQKYKHDLDIENLKYSLNLKEKELINMISQFPEIIEQAAKSHSPAIICNYVYELVKYFNNFYQNYIIIDFEELSITKLRLSLAIETSKHIKKSFNLLGIKLPTRM
ncbi:arginine--tRNA ligase [Psychroflexus sp. ALD_RP9]|uniref:arginine--tRNA ligase n=1 Tax=Psychroflexus sp. ALD_RP9 TaxID=2777186 RepID=UPI001A8DC5F8|nr:arginine--tRNA ligase [Psychroflexus sp. ALD_RP9]QSS97517.1 arginine--tRNA ligase [Psychroflexus sp. ALD_RP9]